MKVVKFVFPMIDNRFLIGAYAPLLCSYFDGSQGHSPTFEQAHVGSDLLTLVHRFVNN